jgi:hypothetical protein
MGNTLLKPHNAKPYLALGAIVLAPFVWSSDGFQEWAFPRTYWQEKVSQLETETSMHRGLVISCLLEVEKSQRTADIDIAQLQRSGVPAQAAREAVVSGIKAAASGCQHLQTIHQQKARELREAQARLQSVR